MGYISDFDCQAKFGRFHRITEQMICAGNVEDEAVCKADSGGPLTWKDAQGKWNVIGGCHGDLTAMVTSLKCMLRSLRFWIGSSQILKLVETSNVMVVTLLSPPPQLHHARISGQLGYAGFSAVLASAFLRRSRMSAKRHVTPACHNQLSTSFNLH